MSALTIEKLTKAYHQKTVLDGMDLAINDGEFVSFLGPSGCGKTTTLNIIAGFLAADGGRILIDGQDVTKLSANRRNTAMVFQNYALFPHMTVADNVGYGLRVRKVAKAERGERVTRALAVLGLGELAGRYPGQLSGGQQQRVAVARAIAIRPGVLLMDEPLSNLDAKLRGEVRTELCSIQRELKQTVVFVTHDQVEALTMSDRIVVMNGGRVEQIGSPEEVYERPRTVFVADFMGVKNILHGAVDGNGWRSETGLLIDHPVTTAAVGIRPTDIRVISGRDTLPESSAVAVSASVRSTSYLGDSVEYMCLTAAGPFTAVVPRTTATSAPGDDVTLSFPKAACLPLQPSASQP